MNALFTFFDLMALLLLSIAIFSLIFRRCYRLALACFILFAIVSLCSAKANAEVVKNGIVFWSNETAKFWYSGGSKIVIDKNTWVTSYNLKEGWVKIHSNIPTILSFCDPFSGKWVKRLIKKGDTNVTLPFKPQEYGGLRLLIISSPWGFGFIKEREEPFSFWDYPIVILRSELAKFGWIRAFYSVSLFVVGLALARYFKKDRLIVQANKHLAVILIGCLAILAVLGMTYTTETVRINGTTKEVFHLVFSTYRMKDMYNYCYILFFVAGYVLGYLLWRWDYLYVAYASYSQPLRICMYPYDAERGIIRDFDGKLTLIDFKNDFKQFINIELNGYKVTGILAIDSEDLTYEGYKGHPVKINYALAGFFGFLALSMAGDYLNVFRIDLFYSFLFGGIIAVITNWQAVKEWFGYYVEKIKLFECSQLMNEENYVKMLKEAEISHLFEDYEKLLRDYVREKITMPRRTVKHLLGVIKQVRVTKAERREKDGEDKD